MASNDATYTVAGTSIAPNSGVKTFRFSNGALNLRANMLRHKGHEDIKLIELPKAMTAVQAIAYLLDNVKGTKGAVVATRSADKKAKTEVVIEAEKLLAKRLAARAKRAEKQSEKIAA